MTPMPLNRWGHLPRNTADIAGAFELSESPDKNRVSTPWFDNLPINTVNGRTPEPSAPLPGQTPTHPTVSQPGNRAHS
jgi:hypothetical protein